MQERDELEVILKGTIATLRAVADELEELQSRKKADSKLSSEAKKVVRPVVAALLLVSQYSTELELLLPENQPKKAGPSPIKLFKKLKLDQCPECLCRHGKFKSCDAASDEEEE